MNKGMSLSAYVDNLGMVKETGNFPAAKDTVYDVTVGRGTIRQVDGNGLTHKIGGPAIIHSDGSTEWWWHGKRHRDDGLPAVEYTSGTKEWYVNNENHRIGGPAVIKSCGDELWYLEGKLHREDGPAVTMADGSKKWFIRNQLHREDGPAIEKRSSINSQPLYQWYWEGKPSTEPEVKWRARAKALKTNPPVMGIDLEQLFSVQKIPHNASGPARVWKDGTMEWFLDGRRHRVEGPAVTLPNGEEYYYLYDSLLSKAEHSVRVNTKENKPVEHIDTSSSATSSTEVRTVPMLPAPKEELKVEAKLEQKVDEKDKNKVKQWSDEPDELVLYDEIYAPLKAILEKGYRLIRNGTEWKFDYNGYEIGKMEKKIFPPAKEHFTEKFLKREKDKHDRSLFDVVMRLLFLMGIEQGRRMAYQEQAPVRSLQKTLSEYRERNKSVRYQLAKANAIIKIREENPTVSPEEINKLIVIELEKTRQSRIDEIKKEMMMDPTLTCFKSKAKKKTKLTELLALANTLDSDIFKQPDWLRILEEANCSQSEWKIFCKKNKFHKFIG